MKQECDSHSFLPVEMNRKVFVFAFEFDQAEGLHGHLGFPSPTTTGIEYTSIEMNREAVPSNGCRMWTNPDEERIQRADPGNYFTLVDFWLSSDQQKKVAELYPEETYQEYLDARVELLRREMERNGDRIWWSICGEQDGGVLWPDQYFSDKKEAYEYYRDCYFTNLPGRYHNSNRKMADFEMMRERYQIDFQRDNIAMQVSKCFSTHYPYEWGMGLVWMERTGALGSAQTAVAFMRGAGRQYDGYWGMDLSGWGGVVDGACRYDTDGCQICGVTDSLIAREMVYYYYAGANLVHLESTPSSCWIENDNEFSLSPYGEKCREFSKHTLIKHPDRGEAYVPFAVMLEHDHGWDDRDERIWGGRLKYGPGERMIDNFFEFVFPSSAKSCYLVNDIDDKEYHQRREIGERPGDHSLDWHEYEHGLLNASRFGDSFDVLLENCPLDRLKRYKVLILLGGIKISDELKGKLTQYVQDGGELIVNFAHFDQIDPDFTGIRDTGRIGDAAIFKTIWGSLWDEGCTTTPIVEAREGATVLATGGNGSVKNAPVIVKSTLGEGTIYLTTVPYMQKNVGKSMLPHCQELLNEVLSKHELLTINGAKIQYLVSQKENGLIATLINNSKHPWQGSISLKNQSVKVSSCHDIWRNINLMENLIDGELKNLKCEPFDTRIIEFKYL